MFKAGDHVIYGASGVCVIKEIGCPNFMRRYAEKDYYTLMPVFASHEDKIFVPTDKDDIRMRRVLTHEEATELIQQMPSLQIEWVADSKEREARCKQALQSMDCLELARLVKSLHQAMEMRRAEGKSPLVADQKYFDLGQQALYGELAFALEMPIDEVPEYIAEKLQQQAS